MIGLIPSNYGKLLLINDWFASGGGVSIVVDDLETGKKWRIDETAIKDSYKYLGEHQLPNGKYVERHAVFSAIGISSDDKKAIIESLDDLNGVPNHEFQPLIYVVNIYNGKILETYIGQLVK